MEELFENTYPHFPFRKTFQEARGEPLVVVHTSGTTSLPKPIIYTHDFAASYIQLSQLVPPPGFESQIQLVQGNRLFVTLPAFHVRDDVFEIPCDLGYCEDISSELIPDQAGNLFATLFDAIANQTVVILPLAGALPSAQLVSDALKHTKADAAILAPPYVEQIAQNPAMLDIITSNLETAAYGGGDVSQPAGDTLSAKMQLFNFNGSTESALFPLLRPSGRFLAEDWKYIHPHPAGGLEFRPRANGLYEAYVVRSRDFEHEQPVFKVFPHLQEFATKDLFSPHPSKPNLWTYRGRADDIIVLQTGMLTNPIAMEQHISRHPKVQGAVIAGTGRFQLSILIEPAIAGPLDDPQSHAKLLLDELWPIIEEGNQAYQQKDSRIFKSHVIFTQPDIPMQRAGKGTVQRAPTLELYRDALDALYEKAGDRTTD